MWRAVIGINTLESNETRWERPMRTENRSDTH